MIRSFLFTPANNPRRVAKALESAADAVILDLEDAVAVEEKPAARAAIVELLKQRHAKPVYVRVNALATPFGFDDLHAMGAAGPDGIIVPKIETAAELGTVDGLLGELEAGT
jgi:citrate lyase subunit beta/citryl-CoA lyase